MSNVYFIPVPHDAGAEQLSQAGRQLLETIVEKENITLAQEIPLKLTSHDEVTAAMAGLFNFFLIGIIPHGIVELGSFFHTLGLIPGVVAEHNLAVGAPNIFHLALGAADAVGIVVRAVACADSEHRAVVVEGGDNSTQVAGAAEIVKSLGGVIGAADGESSDTDGLGTGEVHHGTEGVGGIIGFGEEVTPVVVKVAVTLNEGEVGA